MTVKSNRVDRTRTLAADTLPAKGVALESMLTYRLHVLKKLTDRQTEALYARTLGVSLSDARCISTVGNFGAMSIGDLAAYSNLAKSQASRAADHLVRRQLLSKTVDSKDSRSMMVALTKSGTSLYKQISKLVEQRNREIAACLSANEQASFNALLDRLLAAAKSAEPAP